MSLRRPGAAVGAGQVKRSPLKRGKPMSRGKPRPKAERKPTKYARRERDWDRMAWVKLRTCVVGEISRVVSPVPDDVAELWLGGPDIDPCSLAVEAHHAGMRAGWRKAPDDTCIPLCSHHHRALTDRTGEFSGWPVGELKAWELSCVAWVQTEYAAHQEVVQRVLF